MSATISTASAPHISNQQNTKTAYTPIHVTVVPSSYFIAHKHIGPIAEHFTHLLHLIWNIPLFTKKKKKQQPDRDSAESQHAKHQAQWQSSIVRQQCQTRHRKQFNKRQASNTPRKSNPSNRRKKNKPTIEEQNNTCIRRASHELDMSMAADRKLQEKKKKKRLEEMSDLWSGGVGIRWGRNKEREGKGLSVGLLLMLRHPPWPSTRWNRKLGRLGLGLGPST